MNSILNSISPGNLQVPTVPKDNPIKKDSIINLLQNSEIEFKQCPKFDNNLDNFNTGFGEKNDLHFDDPCKKPELKTPLYKENYFGEFVTEEEKAAARHALGLYNKGDIVAMSLLTAEDSLPSLSTFEHSQIKQLQKGGKFFAPITTINAVYDSSGNTLNAKLKEINFLIEKNQKDLLKINTTSESKNISSLGDIKIFLQGFNNGENLKKTIDTLDQNMLRFEITGQIII